MPNKIVWIEDDTDIIDPVIRPLERAGHTFLRIHTVKDALNSVEEIRTADLILLDMLLPPGQIEDEFGRYPGKNVLERLRKEYAVTTPVVVLTVVARENVLQELRELKVDDIVRKPVKPSELKERVELVLTSHR